MRCRELLFAGVIGTAVTVADAMPIDATASPADNAGAQMERQTGFDAVREQFDFVGGCCSLDDLLRLSGASPWSAEAAADTGTPLSAFVVGPATAELQLIPAPGTLALAMLAFTVLGLIGRARECIPVTRANGFNGRRRSDEFSAARMVAETTAPPMPR